jgi:hypothetical protein
MPRGIPNDPAILPVAAAHVWNGCEGLACLERPQTRRRVVPEQGEERLSQTSRRFPERVRLDS